VVEKLITKIHDFLFHQMKLKKTDIGQEIGQSPAHMKNQHWNWKVLDTKKYHEPDTANNPKPKHVQPMDSVQPNILPVCRKGQLEIC